METIQETKNGLEVSCASGARNCDGGDDKYEGTR